MSLNNHCFIVHDMLKNATKSKTNDTVILLHVKQNTYADFSTVTKAATKTSISSFFILGFNDL